MYRNTCFIATDQSDKLTFTKAFVTWLVTLSAEIHEAIYHLKNNIIT